MRIALLDTTLYEPTTPLFLDAVRELGHECVFIDEHNLFPSRGMSTLGRVAYRLLGRRPLTYWRFNAELTSRIVAESPDVLLVVKGAYLSPGSLQKIKRRTNAILVNFATDDPFNPRNSTPALRTSIPLYDLYCCTKKAIMDDVRIAGSKRVCYVPFGFKPSVHFWNQAEDTDQDAKEVDVTFVGGADADRVPYFRLLSQVPGLRLSLYGGGWDRVSDLCQYWRGMAIGAHYRKAHYDTKIAVALVRRANRDGHSMRTFEVPACGAFMLAERTEEHLEIFQEGLEAAYFTTPEELVEKVRYYLGRPGERQRIAAAGYSKITLGGCTYTHRLEQILAIVKAEIGG